MYIICISNRLGTILTCHAHFFGIFSTGRILKIVNLGMKEYNQCFKSVLLKYKW